MGDIGKILGENITLFRKQHGFTQETLAERAELSLTGIQAIEQNRRWAEHETIRKIAAALGLPEEVLFQAPREPTIPEALAAIARAHGLEVAPAKRRRQVRA